jgi:hypothetical protein
MESIDVTFVSVWDGDTEIRTPAKYNPETRMVHDIVQADPVDDDGEELEFFEYEYIEFEDGKVMLRDEFEIED